MSILPSHAAGCRGNVQVIGTETLCPGETGLYRCFTRELSRQGWTINGVTDRFPTTDIVGDVITEIPGAIGYLLERNADLGQVGNRTTVLFYTPDAGATSGDILIQCSGGGGNCPFVTRFIGT